MKNELNSYGIKSKSISSKRNRRILKPMYLEEEFKKQASNQIKSFNKNQRKKAEERKPEIQRIQNQKKNSLNYSKEIV